MFRKFVCFLFFWLMFDVFIKMLQTDDLLVIPFITFAK